MFKFLKNKLKDVVSKFSHDIEEEVEDTTTENLEEQPVSKEISQEESQKNLSEKEEINKENKDKKKKEIKKEKSKKKKENFEKESKPKLEKKDLNQINELEIKEKVEINNTKTEEIIDETVTEPDIKEKKFKEETPKKRKGFFGKISQSFTTKTLSESKFEELFFEIEIAMLENNVALQVIDKIKNDLKEELVNNKLPKGNITGTILNTLKNSIETLFEEHSPIDIISEIKKKDGPYVIALIGVNGSGKTTATAKLANYFLKENLEPIFAAADTFRAAAIHQLEEHATNLKIPIIKQDYGSDPAAVAYDAIEHAKAKGKDVVLIDTSGRLHSNINLMQELHKIERVAKPDLTIFIGESITGNDCIEQAQKFNEIVGFDGVILTKADIDEKGGTFLSISYVTKKPILFVGIGQTYEDLKVFDKKEVLENLGF